MMIKPVKSPFIFDGAMGTYYASVAPNPLSNCELANLFDRNTVIKNPPGIYRSRLPGHQNQYLWGQPGQPGL